jgi:hypothetical protein
MNWIIELGFSDAIMRDFNIRSKYFRIYHEGSDYDGGIGCYYLISDHWVEITDVIEVEQRSKGLIEILNGIICFTRGMSAFDYHNKINIQFIYTEKSRFDKHQPSSDYGSIDPRVDDESDITLDDSLVRNKQSYLFSLAMFYPSFNAIFRVIGSGDINWRDLYIIFETIRSEFENLNDMCAKLIFTKQIINDFTATCNSYAAIGPLSRHGVNGKIGVSKKRIDLGDARNLTFDLLNSFINYKYCYQCVTFKKRNQNKVQYPKIGFSLLPNRNYKECK